MFLCGLVSRYHLPHELGILLFLPFCKSLYKISTNQTAIIQLCNYISSYFRIDIVFLNFFKDSIWAHDKFYKLNLFKNYKKKTSSLKLLMEYIPIISCWRNKDICKNSTSCLTFFHIFSRDFLSFAMWVLRMSWLQQTYQITVLNTEFPKLIIQKNYFCTVLIKKVQLYIVY